jgi:hypothetical protein
MLKRMTVHLDALRSVSEIASLETSSLRHSIRRTLVDLMLFISRGPFPIQIDVFALHYYPALHSKGSMVPIRTLGVLINTSAK